MLAKLSETPSKWNRVLGGRSNDLLREVIERDPDEESNIDLLLSNAKVRIDEAQRKSAERYNLRRKTVHEYKVGDYVEIRSETTVGINKKLV